MSSLKLKQFKQASVETVSLTWNDGHVSAISVHLLRDSCPCASCNGESVLFHTYAPPEPDRNTPGRYELKGAEIIGGYGLKITWGDGHDTGIYTWDQLRSLCECDDCVAQRIHNESNNA